MNCLPVNLATRRYKKRFFIAMGCYVALLFSTVFLLKHHQIDHLLVIALAILPSLPIVATIVIVGLYLKEERDEFQRSVLERAMLWATGCVLAVSSVWGFLEMFAELPHLPSFYIFPGFWFLVGVCTPLVKMGYRGVADE